MTTPPVLQSRRLILLGGAAALAAGGGLAAFGVSQLTAGAPAPALTPLQAHAAATAGEILLIDIRRPDEWARTGVGAGATPLDMRRRDFTQALTALAEGDTSRPIALICAAGVRSRRTAARLAKAGFTNIIDVPEGMTGSRAGPGWVGRGLPTLRP